MSNAVEQKRFFGNARSEKDDNTFWKPASIFQLIGFRRYVLNTKPFNMH